MLSVYFSQHPGLLGENGSNLPNLVAIIAEVFHLETLGAESPTYLRLKGFISSLHQVRKYSLSPYLLTASGKETIPLSSPHLCIR